ncbi:hypothetical protein ACFYVR_18645 [Rhodococcus sp. NPDC003318]
MSTASLCHHIPDGKAALLAAVARRITGAGTLPDRAPPGLPKGW